MLISYRAVSGKIKAGRTGKGIQMSAEEKMTNIPAADSADCTEFTEFTESGKQSCCAEHEKHEKYSGYADPGRTGGSSPVNQKEWDRMLGGQLYMPLRVGGDSWGRVHSAQMKFNASEFWKDRSALDELRKCFRKAPDDLVLIPPVYFDHGNRISFGKHFFANTDFTILDENYVTFGDNVYIAPHVSIYTAGHPVDAAVRNTDLEYARPVTIDNDVWIGGNVVINPGVAIGNNVVIGSGSVVTQNIPDNVIAAGNPCRVIRAIDENDRQVWEAEYKEYLAYLQTEKEEHSDGS